MRFNSIVSSYDNNRIFDQSRCELRESLLFQFSVDVPLYTREGGSPYSIIFRRNSLTSSVITMGDARHKPVVTTGAVLLKSKNND